MKILFLVLSIILPLCSPFVYARSILQGGAKPHRTTRFVLLVISFLTTISLFTQGDRVALWLSAVALFQSITIFILSIRYGMGGWGRNDMICLLLAISGIIAWKTTNSPLLALYFGIGADIIGQIPTMIKTYRQPETELWTFYGIDATAGVFNLLALTQYTVQSAVYPAYIVLINIFIAFLALRKKTLSI